MAKNVLKPKGDYVPKESPKELLPEGVLLIDNNLSEFETKEQKEIVRTNLGVPSSDEVIYSKGFKEELEKVISDFIEEHNNDELSHNLLESFKYVYENFIKSNGENSFTNPISGVAPLLKSHLTTKEYVDSLLEKHNKMDSAHNNLFVNLLTDYVKSDDVYGKDELYTRDELDTKFLNFILKDGSVSFVEAIGGVLPSKSYHLTTKQYVDELLDEHLNDDDAHGFISLLNKTLVNYIKNGEVYTTDNTYSKDEVDKIVTGNIQESVSSEIESHINEIDPHNILKEIDKRDYVKSNGTVPFIKPIKGVEAKKENELVILSQVQKLIQTNKTDSSEDLKWKTSGPSEAAVGFIEIGDNLPDKLTFQETMDTIIYGKKIQIESPETALYGEVVKLKITIHGNPVMITDIYVYQDNKLLKTINKDELINGELTIDSLPLKNDTEFKLNVFYISNTDLTATSKTLINFVSFSGAIPYGMMTSSLSYNFLLDLAKRYPNQMSMFDGSKNEKHLQDINFDYNEDNSEYPKKLVVVTPISVNDLSSIESSGQKIINIKQSIENTPFTVDEGVVVEYKVFVYDTPLYILNTNLTYNF